MNICERENEILDALHSGAWPEELRAHAAGCAGCRELAAVTGALLEPAPAVLPSASFLWWKGQIQARREAAERLERPLAVAEWVAVAGSVLGLAILANWMVAAAVAGIAVPVALYWRWSHR